MEIGHKIFTIRNLKVVEYAVVQIKTVETQEGIETEVMVKNSGLNFEIKKVDIESLTDTFATREDAQETLDLVKKYINK